MPLNACLQLKITIGGIDFTPNYLSFAIGLTHLDESGLCRAIGTLELVPLRNVKEPIPLDPRKRPDFWFKGQSVIIDAWNTNSEQWQRHPLGTLNLIREPDPPGRDGQNITLKLDVGCILSRFDFKEPDQDKTQIVTGIGQNRTTIINKILEPDIPPIANTIPGSIPYSINKSEPSHVQTAGKVAFAAGYSLWQRKDGIVEAKKIDIENPDLFWLCLEAHCIGYTPAQNQETPCEEVKTTGVVYQIKDSWQCVNSEFINTYRGTGTQPQITKITKIKECWDARGKTREVFEEEWERIVYPNELPDSEALTFSLQDLTVWEYESSRPGSKLRSIKRTVIRPFSAALGSWWANLSKDNRLFFDYRSRIIATEEETVYAYTTEDLTQQIVLTRRSPLAAIVSIIAHNYYIYPSTLVDAGGEKQIWEEINPGEYQKISIESLPIYQFNSSLVPAIEIERAADGLANDNVEVFLRPVAETTTESSSAGGVQPPAPERRPERFSQVEKPLEGSYKVQNYSGQKDRVRVYQIDYCVSEAEMDACAKILSTLLIGRKLGFEVEIPWFDEFFELSTPFPRIDIVERDGLIQVGIASGIAFSHTPDESIISFQHVWLGTRNGSLLQQQYQQSLIDYQNGLISVPPIPPDPTDPFSNSIRPPIPPANPVLFLEQADQLWISYIPGASFFATEELLFRDRSWFVLYSTYGVNFLEPGERLWISSPLISIEFKDRNSWIIGVSDETFDLLEIQMFNLVDHPNDPVEVEMFS